MYYFLYKAHSSQNFRKPCKALQKPCLASSGQKVLSKKSKNKHASSVSPQTTELINTFNKGAKRYKRTRQEVYKDQWQLLQGQVSAAIDLDSYRIIGMLMQIQQTIRTV